MSDIAVGSSHIKSISSDLRNVRQEVFPLDQWTITTRKGKIMQSKCTCKRSPTSTTDGGQGAGSYGDAPSQQTEGLCNICKHHELLPHLNHMPDMLFSDNILKLEHYTGVGIEFNALDALRCVEVTEDPLRVAVADGWQSARAEFPFANRIVKPFDWTFSTDYKGSLLPKTLPPNPSDMTTSDSTNQPTETDRSQIVNTGEGGDAVSSTSSQLQRQQQQHNQMQHSDRRQASNTKSLIVEETTDRIDVNKLKVREEILFYDDVTLFEDELADHGTSQYSVKVRVMPKCLFILARFYLRIDGVLARINDTRVYHEFSKRHLLREFTNREAKLNTLNHLPISTITNPNELTNHLPLIRSSYEKITLARV